MQQQQSMFLNVSIKMTKIFWLLPYMHCVMVKRRPEWCVMTQRAVSDRNRKRSIDQTVLFNRSFHLVVADKEVIFVGLSFCRMQPLNWDTAYIFKWQPRKRRSC